MCENESHERKKNQHYIELNHYAKKKYSINTYIVRPDIFNKLVNRAIYKLVKRAIYDWSMVKLNQ
jgi:hypothetical protein